MSLIQIPWNGIPDDNAKISVGVVVRKVVLYLYEELVRVIKELAPMNNLENKKNTLQNLVREFHSASKKLHKFLKNAKSFPKISRIDKLSWIMYEFNNRVTQSVDQLYYTNEMCKRYRLPAYNLEQSIKFINNTSHSEFKKRISTALNSVMFQEKKENIFYFLEKFFYNENINEKDKIQALEKMKRESIFELNLANNLLTIQNTELREFASYKNDQIVFNFGEVSFKIILFSFQIDQLYLFSYFCQDITLSNNQKYFIKTTESIKKNLPYLNDTMYSKIQIPILNDNSQLDMKLPELQTVLRNFTSKYIYKNVFHQLKFSIKEFVNKKIKLPIKVTIPNPNEIKLSLEYEINSASFSIEMKMSSKDEANTFTMNFSHGIVNENPLVFTNHDSLIINFNQLGKLNLEKIISQKIIDFQKIHLYLIYTKCKSLKSLYLPIKVSLDEENAKIKFHYKDKFLLFSLLNNLKGNIQIIDDTFIFSSTSNENNKILKAYILQFLKGNFEENMRQQFDEFVFKNFIENYFYMNKIFLSYEIYNSDCKGLLLKILITECKSLNKQVFLHIPLLILPGNKFSYSEISCSVFTKGEVIFSLPIDQNIIMKELKLNKQNNIEKFEIETLNKIVAFVNYITDTYQDLFRNVMESISFVNNIKQDSSNSKIHIKVDENLNQFQNFIDKETFELVNFYIKEIEIPHKHLIFKIILNEENLRLKLPRLDNYSILETDHIITFNSKDCVLSFYFLTKLNMKMINDYNYFKRFFKFLNTLLTFLKKEEYIINSNEMKTILNASENVLISPIGFQFKHNFFNRYTKTIFVQLMISSNNEKRNVKCMIFPLEYQLFTNFFEMLNRNLLDSDEKNFMSHLNNLLFVSLIYNRLSKKFSTYTLPMSMNSYDLISKRIFVLLKDYRTFHLIKQNENSLFIEVISPNEILIYSPYMWNPLKCNRFINSIFSDEEIQPENLVNPQMRRLIRLNNDPVSLLNDLNAIFDHFECF